MPLIQHSDQFKQKQKEKDRLKKEEKKAKRESIEKEKRAIEYVDRNELFAEFDKFLGPKFDWRNPLAELSELIKPLNQEELEQYRKLVEKAHLARIPIIQEFAIDELRALFQIIRHVRLNREFCIEALNGPPSLPNIFRLLSNISTKLNHNIKHLDLLVELGVEEYAKRYDPRTIHSNRMKKAYAEKKKQQAINENRKKNNGLFKPNPETKNEDRPYYIRPLRNPNP